MDTTTIAELLVQTNARLAQIYGAQLFFIAVFCAVGVVVLLYKFIRLFY